MSADNKKPGDGNSDGGNCTQFVSFHLGKLLFGIDVKVIQEIIRFQEMTRVPLAPPLVRGLINLRGDIIPALDLRVRLGLEPFAQDSQPMNVVVRTSEGAVSLLIDDIGDVLELSPNAYERVPGTVSARIREVVTGVFKLEKSLMLVMSPDAMINTAPQ